MKVKQKLVFEKHARNLTGFIDLGKTYINTLNSEKEEDLATHALVFLFRAVISN